MKLKDFPDISEQVKEHLLGFAREEVIGELSRGELDDFVWRRKSEVDFELRKTEKVDTCSTCKYWRRHLGSSTGTCVRYPSVSTLAPTTLYWPNQHPYKEGEMALTYEQPSMGDIDYCGEYIKKKESNEA